MDPQALDLATKTLAAAIDSLMAKGSPFTPLVFIQKDGKRIPRRVTAAKGEDPAVAAKRAASSEEDAEVTAYAAAGTIQYDGRSTAGIIVEAWNFRTSRGARVGLRYELKGTIRKKPSLIGSQLHLGNDGWYDPQDREPASRSVPAFPEAAPVADAPVPRAAWAPPGAAPAAVPAPPAPSSAPPETASTPDEGYGPPPPAEALAPTEIAPPPPPSAYGPQQPSSAEPPTLPRAFSPPQAPQPAPQALPIAPQPAPGFGPPPTTPPVAGFPPPDSVLAAQQSAPATPPIASPSVTAAPVTPPPVVPPVAPEPPAAPVVSAPVVPAPVVSVPVVSAPQAAPVPREAPVVPVSAPRLEEAQAPAAAPQYTPVPIQRNETPLGNRAMFAGIMELATRGRSFPAFAIVQKGGAWEQVTMTDSGLAEAEASVRSYARTRTDADFIAFAVDGFVPVDGASVPAVVVEVWEYATRVSFSVAQRYVRIGETLTPRLSGRPLMRTQMGWVDVPSSMSLGGEVQFGYRDPDPV